MIITSNPTAAIPTIRNANAAGSYSSQLYSRKGNSPLKDRKVAPFDDLKLNRLAICCCARATPGRKSESSYPCYQLSNTLRSPFRHGLSELEAVMAYVVSEVLLYCCGAEFVADRDRSRELDHFANAAIAASRVGAA